MGRKLPESEKLHNIRELSKFRSFWRGSPDYPKDNLFNDSVRYPVDVTYTWENGRSEIEFSSEFRAIVGAGLSDGNIDIADITKVRIEEFHLSFKPAFQEYEYDRSDHSLLVSGESTKMGGKYQLRIKPNIEEP